MIDSLARKPVEEGQPPEEVSVQEILSDPKFLNKRIGDMDLNELENARRVLKEVFGWDIKPIVD